MECPYLLLIDAVNWLKHLSSCDVCSVCGVGENVRHLLILVLFLLVVLN